jgi:hypothetical protein
VDWHKCLPRDLYLRWLSAPVRRIEKPDAIVIDFPTWDGANLVKKATPFRPDPGVIVPGILEDSSCREGVILGPLRPQGRVPLSQETESQALYGKANWELDKHGRKTESIITTKSLRFKGRSYGFEWAEPFNHMYELGTSLDTLYLRTRIAQYVRDLKKDNYTQMLEEFQVIYNRFVTTATAPLSHVYFLPYKNVGPEAREGIVATLEDDFNLRVDTLSDLATSEEFIALLQKPVEVTRINTWTGLFVYQFYQDLEDRNKVGVCEHCGGFIRGGHADRRFCYRTENEECFLKRDAKRKKRGRTT